MKINEMVEKVHKNAIEKGWHTEKRSFGELVALCHCELSEAIEEYRDGRGYTEIYVEVKRQDGWVEGGKRSDGRGNAHERSSKYFTPGLLKILREKSKITEPNLPFWTVFQGDITRDPCRVREITLWFDSFKANYFFWRDTNNADTLINHFEEYIIPIIS